MHHIASIVIRLINNKILILVVFILMLVTGSTIAWVYYFNSDLPKKIPVRAKQVFFPIQYFFVDGDNPFNAGQNINEIKLRNENKYGFCKGGNQTWLLR
ncbi:MAG TPA: hypothetical protein PKA28_02085 [Methylomusa anaerophila]|uniref:Uncharacterized protein n=1 Tax=Methylomusa anaerophila TaxID=1930071 RepID=A0A348APE6_9FIRM|nr:hypothetical protein [Methylomusa anaerophila]BBB92944.1 hypothetical protein MAMMFC1_03652 [Methylomusa anaerophila]HML87222.1 hypothetical protein [Methylomusa anaerophila]